jgi:hypothetical protein
MSRCLVWAPDLRSAYEKPMDFHRNARRVLRHLGRTTRYPGKSRPRAPLVPVYTNEHRGCYFCKQRAEAPLL